MKPSLVNLLTTLHGSLLTVIEIQSPAFFPRDDLAVVPGDCVVDCLGALVTLLTLLPLHVAVLLDMDFPTLFVWDVFTDLSGHFGALFVVNCFTLLLGNLDQTHISYFETQQVSLALSMTRSLINSIFTLTQFLTFLQVSFGTFSQL